MSLPSTVSVKLSSEAAGAITITPVVVREMPARELVEILLGATGKQVDRIQEILRRGSLVSGSTRFRWAGWEADAEGIREVLASFPDPDPDRAFREEGCSRAVLRGGACLIELPREVAARRRFLRRSSFWDVVLDVARAGRLEYLDYSYKERADWYRVTLSASDAARLRSSAGTLTYSTLAGQIRSGLFDSLDLYVPR